mmetsp:Transcript_35481/g.75766  ORF Transcript_35481/g.75766 Transcript_35481/m.75766 type:complete len:205 (-) Transcript_35481:834-1448(-)
MGRLAEEEVQVVNLESHSLVMALREEFSLSSILLAQSEHTLSAVPYHIQALAQNLVAFECMEKEQTELQEAQAVDLERLSLELVMALKEGFFLRAPLAPSEHGVLVVAHSLTVDLSFHNEEMGKFERWEAVNLEAHLVQLALKEEPPLSSNPLAPSEHMLLAVAHQNLKFAEKPLSFDREEAGRLETREVQVENLERLCPRAAL